MSDHREAEVVAAFVTLATSLADGLDVVDLLSGLTADCVRLLDVDAAGLLLADGTGALHLLAASSDATRELELFQVQRAEGPCLDCFHTGTAVNVPDLREQTARWPVFAPQALEVGFVSVHAVPMRLRDNVLGALNLFKAAAGSLRDADLALAQALAHVASVALIQDRASADRDVVVSQLESALTSRLVLEQAKGVLAEVGRLQMDGAFQALRRYARDHNLRLTDVAEAVVSRALPARTVLEHFAAKVGSRPEV